MTPVHLARRDLLPGGAALLPAAMLIGCADNGEGMGEPAVATRIAQPAHEGSGGRHLLLTIVPGVSRADATPPRRGGAPTVVSGPDDAAVLPR